MLKHRSLLAAAFLTAAASATAQTAQPQGAQPTPKRPTKAEKKAAKRARNAGVTAVQPAQHDEDEQWAVDRGADLLEHYAEYIRRVKPEDIEQHPYLPELEAVAVHLRALSKRSAAGVLAFDEAQAQAAFEAWAKDNHWRLDKLPTGDYLTHDTRAGWYAWRELAKRNAGVAGTLKENGNAE